MSKNIKKWAKRLIALAFKVLEKEVLSKIEIKEFKEVVQNKFNQLKDFISLLTDNDPNNKVQMAKLWKERKNEILFGDLDKTLIGVLQAKCPEKAELILA